MKKILFTFIFLTAIFQLQAAKVTESQARAIAGKFFGVTMPERPATMKAKAKAGHATPFYVFNNPEKIGWVIVSGDDRAVPILAYGDEDYFYEDEVPECVNDWLGGYVEQIESLYTGSSVVEPEPTSTSVIAATKSKVAPLLGVTKWAQGLPFNQGCPSYTESSETKYCPAGCVAIAMAQIMYYHKSNYGSDAIPAYTSQSDDFTADRPALPATKFNWAIMNPWYDDARSSSASAKEVQKLVKYCGQAVEMDYGKKSSGATSDRNAFTHYFGYDRYSQQISRTDVSASTWENVIYTELAQGRPVYFSARKLNGGHAFVCDGYDGEGLYHINWGWRGGNNGFYALNALSDGNSGGTGAASGDEGYTIKLQIIIGLEPSTSSQTSQDYNTVSLYSTLSTPNGTSYSRSGSSSAFTNVALIANYWNSSCQTYTYDLGWALFNSNGNVMSTHTVKTNYSLQGGHYTYPTSSISLGQGLSSGTYYLKPICRISGTTTWSLARGSGVNFIKATITSTKLNLQVYDDQSVQNLTVNSVYHNGVAKAGSPMQLEVNVTNNGLTDYNYIYLWADGTLTTATTTDVGIGQSGNVYLSYTPATSGQHDLKLTADRDGDIVLFDGYVTVDPSAWASFTATNSTSIARTSITVQTVLTNTSSSAYNNYIVARMWKHRPTSGNTGYGDNTMSQVLNLSPGSTKTLNFTFSGLEHGTAYHFSIYYYSNGELVKAGSSTSSRTPSLYDINEDGSVSSVDITALYNALLNGDVTYRGYCDLNGDGSVSSVDVTVLYNYMMGVEN